jgi:putative MATE family efflux protein
VPSSGSAGSSPANKLLAGQILPTLVALSAPNVIALGVLSLVTIAETSYIGLIGPEALAAMALVFPMIMLTSMMSSGAMGGGISSAISRALGAGDTARARVLAVHAIIIGAGGGLAFSAIFLLAGPSLYDLLGGRGAVLVEALRYSAAFFSGALCIWLYNTLHSIVRGTGNMRLSSSVLVTTGLMQIAVGGALALGLGPLPRLGMIGVAVGQLFASGSGALFLLWYLMRPTSRLRLGFSGVVLDRGLFKDILKVGAVACLSPLQSIMVVLLLAAFAARYGTAALAGFGIGIRLELLLVPIAFAIGVACVPMVGMAIGAGDPSRARRVAWTGATLSGALIGAIGVVFSIFPYLWVGLFTAAEPVAAAAADYLRIAGVGFPAYGFGLCLYFASQGSGKIIGPVLAGTVRLVVVALGGWWILTTEQPFSVLALLVAVGMVAYGLSVALFVRMTRWGS